MRWTKEQEGYWRSLPWVAVNHPRVFPRGWTLLREGRDMGRFQTLRAAKEHAQRIEDGTVTMEHVFND